MIKKNSSLNVILLIGFIIRILFAFSYDTGDTGAFCHASDLFLQRQEVYAAPDVYFSAPPFGLHLTAVSNFIGKVTGLPCNGMWKMPAIFSDLGIGILLYLIAVRHSRKKESEALLWTKWYIYNPIPIFVSGFQGQQDSFWLFFVLLAWYLIQYKKKIVLAAVSAAIALAYKLPTVLLLPGLFFSINRVSKKLLFFVILIFLFVLSLLPEIVTSTHAVIKQSFLYSSTLGVWGVTGILHKFTDNKNLLSIISFILKICLGISLVIIYIKALREKQFDFFRTSLLAVSAFLVFTPGFGQQYLLWPLPFLILTENPVLLLYTILVTFGYIHAYGLSFPPLDLILNILQNNVYYKLKMLYPYDLFYPVWILLIFIVLNKENTILNYLNVICLKYKDLIHKKYIKKDKKSK